MYYLFTMYVQSVLVFEKKLFEKNVWVDLHSTDEILNIIGTLFPTYILSLYPYLVLYLLGLIGLINFSTGTEYSPGMPVQVCLVCWEYIF